MLSKPIDINRQVLNIKTLFAYNDVKVALFMSQWYHCSGWGFVLIIVIVAKKHCSLGFVIYAFTFALPSICFLLIT